MEVEEVIEDGKGVVDGINLVRFGLVEVGEVVDEEVEGVGKGLDPGEVEGVIRVGEVNKEGGSGGEVGVVVGEEKGEGGGKTEGGAVGDELGGAGEEAEASVSAWRAILESAKWAGSSGYF